MGNSVFALVRRFTCFVFVFALAMLSVACPTSSTAAPVRSTAEHPLLFLSAYPDEALHAFPKDTRVDAHLQIFDGRQRQLVWNIVTHRWNAIDHGLQIDAAESAPSPAEYREALKAFAKVLRRATAHPSVYCQPNCPLPSPKPIVVIASGGDSNVRWSEDVADAPPDLYQGPDGNYYDSNGTEWAYVPGYGWAKFIGSVANTTPSIASDMQPYQTAYNFTHGLEPWFYGLATAPVFGMATFGSLGLNFGTNGATLVMARFLAEVNAKIAAVGVAVTTQAAKNVNAYLATRGYTQAPFAPAQLVGEFSTNASFNSGLIAGEQMVRVGQTSEQAALGPWIMPLSAITNSAGNYLSPAEIQDLYGLEYLPEYVAPVTGILPGSTFFVGQANGIYQNLVTGTTNTGGGLQFFVTGPNLTFGKVVRLQSCCPRRIGGPM